MKQLLLSPSGRARPALFLPVLLLPVLCLMGCAAQPVPPTARTAPARRPPLQFAPGTVVETPPPANEAQLVNDPSAPADTPLCGAAAREGLAMAARVNPAPLASGNACTANACFDPLTGTYIGADGNRHVCR
ncbi:conserved hypothetical protein [Gluconacetobacter diazotrophicus PA1 5]|uniref:Uncharacterized protein n=2 Tax=Gluconacetobacter diazotrophicus TaxID=33996 RepID=A9H4N6_GLUDA|nr:BA14K family protein [Gluconacetobacter diazotrophicus]ACI52596.1 conserved hypothetical protein [Gluconacetobacter diazotrophicus PA1 5]MBB2156748.1 hypothetical protein [Gluconacetobacter diazotrophicus]TWB03135.1 BA14K-like protein [Gluconacetobacter diazotrophicus]CAP57461.1 hypothetical protein GDI3518 [Gluconacetobacter diazotrophicus PA1 5]